ncbi:35907_t:CDS:2 [Gigaspora margarita]|uniref:35907_t:CDS:1 n=1 Tax=Gigaspora margarita TaxID=4874 RepID=A0ABN7V896_GIGMA|nr:35907_t:CDS:2 [Gigaspora margarita]
MFCSGCQTEVDRSLFDAFFDHIKNNKNVKNKNQSESLLTVEFNNGNKWKLTDATLIILSSSTFNTNLDRTGFTINMTEKHKKPCLQICLDKVLVNDTKKKIDQVLDLNEGTVKKIDQVLDWIEKNKIEYLNVAGPRERTSLGIFENTLLFMGFLLKKLEELQTN